jgi:hypothetical protein
MSMKINFNLFNLLETLQETLIYSGIIKFFDVGSTETHVSKKE